MRKKLYVSLHLVDTDPAFSKKYDESKHAAKLAHQFQTDRFVSRGIIILLVKSSFERWTVFDNLGVTKTCRDCACLIDNDTNLPIVCRGLAYNLHITLIIQKAMDPLLDLKQIRQVSDGG